MRAEDLAQKVQEANGKIADDAALHAFLKGHLEDDSTVVAFKRVLDREHFAADDPMYLFLELVSVMDRRLREATDLNHQMLDSNRSVMVALAQVMQGFADVGGRSVESLADIKTWLEEHHRGFAKTLSAVERVEQPGGIAKGALIALILGGGGLAGAVGAALVHFLLR